MAYSFELIGKKGRRPKVAALSFFCSNTITAKIPIQTRNDNTDLLSSARAAPTYRQVGALLKTPLYSITLKHSLL